MRGPLLIVACAALTACEQETVHTAIFLPPPYNNLPSAPAGSIEAGQPVGLDARQQEAVVAGVAKWMKDPGSIQFGTMTGARNGSGRIAVCGQVNGRNGAGSYVGMAPFVGVLMGTQASPDFVVVGIGSSGRERAEVTSLCRDSGILQKD